MSSIQRLEQLPLKIGEVSWAILRSELEETARLLAPALEPVLWGPEAGAVRVDHGILLTVAENLIGNAARYARKKLELTLAWRGSCSPSRLRTTALGFPLSCSKRVQSPLAGWKKTGRISVWACTAAAFCVKSMGALSAWRIGRRGVRPPLPPCK